MLLQTKNKIYKVILLKFKNCPQESTIRSYNLFEQMFQEFQYRLCLPSNNNSFSLKDDPDKKVARIIITSHTDVQKAAQTLCKQHNLQLNLACFIAQSIQQQIRKQATSEQAVDSFHPKHEENKNQKISKFRSLKNSMTQEHSQKIQFAVKKSTLKQQNTNTKSKSFKNKFCSYLNQLNNSQQIQQSPQIIKKKTLQNRTVQRNTDKSPQEREEESSTFRNCDYILVDYLLTDRENQEEYSFRPTNTKYLDITHETEISSFQINQIGDHSSRQSGSEQDQQSENSIVEWKKLYHKQGEKHQQQQKRYNEKNVFDHLYNNYILRQSRMQLERKKSFEKIPFKPEINPNSNKIVEIKKERQRSNQKIWQRLYDKRNNKENLDVKLKVQNLKTKRKSHQPMHEIQLGSQGQQFDPINRVLKQKNQDQVTPIKDKSLQKRNRTPSIYERGELFIKKSIQKLSRFKKQEIQKQMRNCTFKPRLISKQSHQMLSRVQKMYY